MRKEKPRGRKGNELFNELQAKAGKLREGTKRGGPVTSREKGLHR